MIHITLTGILAGYPVCGVNKSLAVRDGGIFQHMPYSHPDIKRFLAAPGLCPVCKAMWEDCT